MKAHHEALEIAEFIHHLQARGRRARLTRLLLVAILAVFVWTTVSAGRGGRRGAAEAFFKGADIQTLLACGANSAAHVHVGQIWRPVTSMFLHVGLVHLVLNAFVLLQIGPVAEHFFGRARFCVLYGVSGVGGSVTSLVFSPTVTSAGASGALFGMVGAMAAGLLVTRAHVPRRIYVGWMWGLVPFIVVNVCLGFMIPSIDNAAHIGGLLTGALLAAALAQPPGQRWRLGLVRAGTIVGVVACIWVGLAHTFAADRTQVFQRRLLRLYVDFDESKWARTAAGLWLACRGAMPPPKGAFRQAGMERRFVDTMVQSERALTALVDLVESATPLGRPAIELNGQWLGHLRAFRECVRAHQLVASDVQRWSLDPTACQRARESHAKLRQLRQRLLRGE